MNSLSKEKKKKIPNKKPPKHNNKIS